MSATDENTDRDLLADFTTDPGDTSAHVLWPADPEQEQSAGHLLIDVDDGRTWSGLPVTVEARVMTSGQEDVQAVVRVQGLEPSWCPLPQVVTVFPGTPTRLYAQLTPAPGTPPGRYLWSLTAEVQDRPMLATTAQLHVDRWKPIPPLPPRSRWRPRSVLTLVAVAVLLVIVALAVVTVFAPSWVFWGRDSAASKPFPKVIGPIRVLPTAKPSTAAGLIPKVVVKGTVLAGAGKNPVQISVVRLSLSDLTGSKTTPSPVLEASGVDKRIRGKHWTLSLPPGLYGVTFSKPGFVSESIVVTTAAADSEPPPHVRLDEITPKSGTGN